MLVVRNMNKKMILYCFLISTIFLIICTKSSPLYKTNDWYDANAFFTTGKAMMIGRVPYLNLFEQKGPLLYLIYGIASLISSNSFIGVFIIEILFNTVFLYYANKIIKLYLPEKFSCLLLPIIAAIIFSSRSFTHGGSCEELIFPFIIVSLYYLIIYLKTSKINNKQVFVLGIIAGLIFWMKYTLLGLHIGFCIVFFIINILNKTYKDLLKKIMIFLLGFIITTIPWVIYYIFNDGLGKMIDTYFLFNMTSYSNKINFFQKIIICFRTIERVLLKYYQYILLIIIPVILSMKTKTFFSKKRENLYLLFCCFSLLFFIFIGGTNFRYYSLPIQPLMILGLIYITTIVIRKIKIEKISLLTIFIIPLCLIIAYNHSPNTQYLKKSKKDYAQFIFADIIEKNKTILNYGFLDGGFYLTTNNIPNIYYFQRNNVKYELYPANTDEQRKYVKNKLIDYVITKNNLHTIDRDLINENYTLIMTHHQKYEEKNEIYYLYKKNN